MVMILAVLFSLVAHANLSSLFTHDTTFCVGGFNLKNQYAESSHACNKSSIRAVHPDWHRHGMVILFHKKTKKCYICWDEVDNTCDDIFLFKQGKHFEVISNYSSSRNQFFQDASLHTKCESSDPSEVFQHVKNGEDISKQSPPPPPKPETLTPEITFRKGPYATGETLTLDVQLVDEDGNLAKDDGQIISPETATFRIVKNGKTISTTIGQIDSDGTFSGDVVLPKTESSFWDFFGDPSYTIQVEVNSNSLPKGYVMGKNTHSEKIRISDCINHLYVDLNGQSTLASLIPTKLNVEMKPNFLADSEIVFTLKVMDPSVLLHRQQSEWTIPASNGTAMWTPPELTQSYFNTVVQIYASGTHDGVEICPSKSVNITLSGQSILPETILYNASAIPLEGLPKIFDQPNFCITGRDCKVGIALSTPPGISNPLLDDSRSVIKVIDNNGDVMFSGPVAERFDYQFTPQTPGVVTPTIQISNTTLNKSASFDSRPITIRDPIILDIPEELNFGHVVENNWKEKCHVINLDKSKLLPKDALRFQVQQFDPNCNMEVVYLNRPNDTQLYETPLPIQIDNTGAGVLDLLLPNSPEFGLCVRTDACGASNSEPDATIYVTPLDASLREFRRNSKVVWTSTKVPFYSWNCWGRILFYTLGLLTFGTVVHGYVSAPRFSIAHELKHSKRKDLSRQVTSYYLADESKRTLKLFRGERLAFDAYLDPTREKGVITCYAKRFGFEVVAPSLEEYDKVKRTWNPVESPFYPSSNRVYKLPGSKPVYIKFFS